MWPRVPEHHPPAETAQLPTVLHGSTSCSPGQPANVQRQDDKAICSFPSFLRSGEILYGFICGVTEGLCHSARGVCVCLFDS
eukprot:superscaffoldBa00001821_g12170